MANGVKWPKRTQWLVRHYEESTERFNHIHCLSDELLMEILRRLPNCKFVMQCKLVCKRWAAMASSPWFIARFIDLKVGDGGPFAIIMWYKPDRFGHLWGGHEKFFRPSIFNAQDSSFSPFHCLGDDNASTTLVASCNDLLLYCRHEKDKKYDFYISNVQTKKWANLPSPPYYYGRYLFYGLICDPFYSYDKEIVINDAYRYSIVVFRITAPSTKVKAHMFSSTNHGDGKWCDRVLSLPKSCSFWLIQSSIYFNGKLYFTCREGIFGFDQNSIEFDDEIQCHVVDWPVGMKLGRHRAFVSEEKLMLSLLENDGALRVWVLKDYKTSNWMLQHSVETRNWVSSKSWMTRKLEKFAGYRAMLVDVLGFHPSNSDVIYVLVPGYIFLCNLSSKTVKLACRIPVAVAEECRHYLKSPYEFPVMLSCWPTPLPRLCMNFEDGSRDPTIMGQKTVLSSRPLVNKS